MSLQVFKPNQIIIYGLLTRPYCYLAQIDAKSIGELWCCCINASEFKQVHNYTLKNLLKHYRIHLAKTEDVVKLLLGI